MPEDEIKRMDIAEFRELGYLQELNRGFLHPLGLALEVIVDENGNERLGGVWDYRDDPEGLRYEGMDLAPKADAIAQERERRRPVREEALGYWQQPIEDQ